MDNQQQIDSAKQELAEKLECAFRCSDGSGHEPTEHYLGCPKYTSGNFIKITITPEAAKALGVEDLVIKMVMELTPDDHDSDYIRFMLGDKQLGFGYKGKEGGIISIQVCPQCRKENYALARATGTCGFCGFDPN